MKSIVKCTFITMAVIVLAGGVWYSSSSVDAADTPQLNPIGVENQSYNLNPEPILKSNKDSKDNILSQKDKVLNNFKLGPNDEILSFELKSWAEYNSINTVNGIEALNTTVDNNRLVWVAEVNFPDGYNSRIGYYKNAKVTYVIDPESLDLLAKDITGDLEKRVGGKFDPSWIK